MCCGWVMCPPVAPWSFISDGIHELANLCVFGIQDSVLVKSHGDNLVWFSARRLPLLQDGRLLGKPLGSG